MTAKVFQRTSNAFQGSGKFVFEMDAAAIHYGVTAGGNGLCVKDGLVHLNAHGLGGNQTGNDPVEGIPYDAPL